MNTRKTRRTFISYSRTNKDFALQLAQELRASGFSIWLDQLDIPTGARWDDELERALKACEIFMVILTPASIESENVKDEIGYAIDTGKRILPVLLENAQVPLRLRRFQYVDFTGKSYDEGVDSAKQILKKLTEEATTPRMETPPADAKTARRSIRRESAAAKSREAVEIQAPPTSPGQRNPMGMLGIAILIVLLGGYAITRFRAPKAGPSPVETSGTVETVSGSATTPTALPVADQVPTRVLPTPTVQVTVPTPTTGVAPTATAYPAELMDGKGVAMVLVPAGEFQMGGVRTDAFARPSEKPVHTVHLDAFYIDKFEVTNASYRACVEAGDCSENINSTSGNRSSYYNNSEFDEYPVVWVDWTMATTYCAWRGARLPTEAEWEKAARGTESPIYPWGNEVAKTYANYGGADTTAVGAYESGKSPYGVYDMAGNVWEWVADWYSADFYQSPPEKNPSGPADGISKSKVQRGGSWTGLDADVRTSNRRPYDPDRSNFDIGFRCASFLP